MSKTKCIGYLGGTDDEDRPAGTDAPAKTEHIGVNGGTDEVRPIDADTDTPGMEEEDNPTDVSMYQLIQIRSHSKVKN